MKDVKKIRLTRPVWEYEEIVNICEEQSKKGYQLQKIKIFGKSIFTKDESKIYKYAIDYFDNLSPKDKKEKYLNMFEEQGWEYVTNTPNGCFVFRKEYNKDLPDEEYEIYTDNQSKAEFLNNIIGLIKFAITLFVIGIILMTIGGIVLIINSNLSAVDLTIFALTYILYFSMILIFEKGIKILKTKK